jgi:hypothetical protein
MYLMTIGPNIYEKWKCGKQNPEEEKIDVDEFDVLVVRVSLGTFGKKRDLLKLKERLERHLKVWASSDDVKVELEAMVRKTDRHRPELNDIVDIPADVEPIKIESGTSNSVHAAPSSYEGIAITKAYGTPLPKRIRKINTSSGETPS